METRTDLKERLRRSRDWVAAIDDIEREVLALDDARQRSEQLFDLAALIEEVVPEPGRALVTYERAWQMDPDNTRALARARELYYQLGRLEKVAELGALELESRGEDGGVLSGIVGEAFLDTGDAERALPLLERAAKADPDSMRVRDALAALSYDPEHWPDTIEMLAVTAEKAEPETAARMLLRAARILHLETPQDERYEELLKQVLGADPHNEAANALYEDLLGRAKRWDDLEAHHKQRAKATGDEAARAGLYRRFALEWLQRFGNRECSARFFARAITTAARAAATNGVPAVPSLVAGFALVRDMCAERGEWPVFLSLADACVAALPDDERLFVAVQAGRVAWKELGDAELAQRYFDIVRAIEPEAPDLLDYDEAVAGGDGAPAAPAGEAAAEARGGEPSDTDAALETSADEPPGGGEAAGDSASGGEAAGDSASGGGEPAVGAASDVAEPAAELAEAATSEPAEEAATAEPQEEPEEEIGDELAAAMQSARAAEGDGADKAVEAWNAVISAHPGAVAPRRELCRVLRAGEQWRPLLDALKDAEKTAARTSDKVEFLREIASVCRDHLRNETQAVSTLGRIIELQPGALDVYDELAEYYESKKRWPDLVNTLSGKAEQLPDPDAKVALYLQIATLYISRFSNQAEAIKAFEKVLEIEPENAEATEHLLQVYEKRRDWEKLIGLKEREIDRADSAAERALKTYEVAQLAAQRVKKPEVCIYWWEKVLATEPAHEEAIGELYKLYERAKDWEKLANICAVQASIAPDAKTQADALQKLGLLYTDKLEDADKAIAAWRQLLDVDPANRRAQDALKKLYIAKEAWDDLEAFYRDQDKLDEFVRVLERQVDSAEGDQLALAIKIAKTYRDEIDKPDRAMRAFEKVLALDENNLEAAEALIPLYEKGRDPRKLVNALTIQLEQTEDPSLRQERIKRLAEYSEEKLRDKGAAFGWWLKAHTEDHEAEWIRVELERLAQETGSWAEVVEAYVQSYDKFADPASALPLMLVVARVQEEELGEVDAALATCRAILDIDDSSEPAINALERLYIGKGQYQDLLDIYQRKLDLEGDVEQRTEIQYKIGQLYEDEVKDDDRAVEAYLAVLDSRGDDLPGLRAIDRIYTRNARHAELADILEREIALVEPDGDDLSEHLELKYRLGQVREQHLSDVHGAIDAYRDILDLQPDHAGARTALEARLSDDDHKLRAAEILEPIYEKLEEWARLIDVHEIQLAASDAVLRRVDLLLRIGQLNAAKLGDAERAFDAYARCFREDPAIEDAKLQLEELCGLLDDGWPRLVALYEEAIASGELDPARAHELAMKVARAYEERLDNTGKAVEFYRRALQVEPDDLTAIEALEQIFTRDEQYAELLDVYRRKADIAEDPDERLIILFRSASIHEEMLHNRDEAISTYNEILGQDPDNLRALRALDRLYVAGEQWHELGDNLSRQLALSEIPGEQVRLQVRLAQLRETHLEELAAAIETYQQVLAMEPQNAEAIAALERLLGNEEHELTIAQILEPIYQAYGNWQRQITVYEIMARHAFDPARKEELLHQIAELYEMGGDSGADAFETYARAFREEPASETTQAQLERLSRMLDRWQDLVVLYDQVIGEVDDETLKVTLLTKLAKIYEIELGDDQMAVATYARILDVSPTHVEAASAIQLIHERNADYKALVDILRRKAEMILDLPERKQLLYKAAQIQEEVLENLDAAIGTYQTVLDLDDIDLPAMDALERLYIRLERWEQLKDVYAKKADLADDPEDKKQMLHVLGQVYDRELGDVARAIDTYQAIVDIDPDDVPAIQQLDRLFGAAERWYDLLQNLERQVELAETAGERVGLKFRIGQLWQDKLQDLSRAIEGYREALEIDPGHHESLVALDGLLRGEEGEPVMAAQVLEPIYEAGAEFAKLVDVLEVMVKHSEDPVQRVELLHRIAELHEHRLDQPADAFGAFCRALREDNANELTLGHLDRLAEQTRSWASLAELYGSEADKSLDVPRQVDLLARLARIQEEELGLTEQAIATYGRILEIEFDDRDAIMALDRLYTTAERWDDLADVLRKEIQLAETDDEIITLQFRLGQVLEQALSDLPRAIDVYRDILSTQPGHAATLAALEALFLDGHYQIEIAEILEPLYDTSGEFEKLHKIYEVQLSKLEGPSERQGMYQRLAELAEGNLGDGARAFQWWGEAACEDPRWELAIEEAERLAGDTMSWDALVGYYTRILERHPDSDVQRMALLRLARVYERELGDAASAIQTHLRVLEIDPKDPDALAALDRLYEAQGMYEELVDVLRRRIEVTLDGDEIIEFQFRRGRIFADALGDLDASLACYESVLEQESRNRTALESCEVIFFRREEWKRLHEVYEKLVDVASGDDELGDVYARMALLSSDALDDEEGAIDLWGRVLDIRGEDPQALAALAALYTRREQWEDLVEVIERQVLVASSPAEQIALYKRLGRIWAEQLERDRNSLEAWLRADQLDGSDLETLRALAHLYQATQSWEELSQTLRRIIAVGQQTGHITEDELIELFAQLGQLEGDILGRVDDAVDAWRKVLALDPGDFRALGALEQLFTREARWEEGIDVLEKRALVLDDPGQRIDTLIQAAAIWEEKVEDYRKAAELYERVRAMDAANAIASEHLESIYRSTYEWDNLIEVLLARLEHTEHKGTRIDILGAVAKIYEEELHDQEKAFLVLEAAFREDYSHERTSREIERLAHATNKWEDLLSSYSEVVQGLESEQPDSACDLWVKIGRWYGEHLSHVEWAIHSVQRALTINENHTGALAALADLQLKQQAWPQLIETVSKHARVETDPDKKVQLYIDLADLYERRMMDPMQAISAYQMAVQTDRASMPALKNLERLYRQHEMWEQLISVLRSMAEQLADEEEIIRLKLEVGELWDVRMLDATKAIGAYQEVLEVDPSNLPALRSLEQLYEKTGQSEQYLEILEAQLDVSPTDAERISLYERMSSAWEERFGKLDRAAECLEKIVVLDPRNFEAYQELARLYRQDSRWDSLVDTYRRHIAEAMDSAKRIELYCAMGAVYRKELNDADRAIEAFKDVLDLDPNEPRALDALGMLYESIEEWYQAIDVMSQLVETTNSPLQQVDLYYRIGRIKAQRLDEAEEAEANFLQSLSIDPSHVPTMEALVELYSARGDWLKGAQMMVRAEAVTDNVLDKIRLLYEAARIYLDRLGQPAEAKQYFAHVIALDPEHVGAAEPLAQLYFDAEEWAPLSPVLDMLVRKAQQEQREPRELNELYYRTAKCADELGDHSKALDFYRAAYEIDSTYLPTLLGRADLLYKMENWEEAGKIYQTILVQHRDSQGEADVVRIYYRLGMVRQQLGDRRRALNMFEKALEIDPAHPDTLAAVIDIQQGQGDFEAVVHAKRGLMASASDEDRVALLNEIGDIYYEKLGNAQKAISAYREALDIAPEDHQLLQKVLDRYTETQQWTMAIEIIERFIALETKPVFKGAYYKAAGDICRRELKALDEAIDYYNKALDSFFESQEQLSESMLQRGLNAFEYIQKILNTKRDWKAQERAFRQMIKRIDPQKLAGGQAVLIGLWHALGEVYRSRLKHYKSAIQAFEIAQQLDAQNMERREILAELYLIAGPDYADKAVEQHMNMLRDNPFKYDSYRALRKIYEETRQYDKTWCMCNALAFLKKADAGEMQFYEQYKPRGFDRAKNRMAPDTWARIYHPDENRFISAIFGAIWEGPATMKALPHKRYQLRRKDKRDIFNDQLQFSKIFCYVAEVLGVIPPEVYLRDDRPGELQLLNLMEKNQLIPSFVVGQSLLQGRPEKEIAFIAAKNLALVRPEHYLRLSLETNTELKIALLAAIVLVKGLAFPVPPDLQRHVQEWAEQLRGKVHPQALEQLGVLVEQFLRNAPEVDLARWGHAVDATSHRVGFVICGDLEVAARMVSAEPVRVGGPQAKDKIKELILYSVSEDYFTVRQSLGLTIG